MDEQAGASALTILVPLDGSAFSERILETVRRFAPRLGASVELLRVARLDRAHDTPGRGADPEMTPMGTATGVPLRVPPPSAQRAPPVETREQKITRIEDHFRDYLRDRARTLEGIPTGIAVAIADDPAQAIADRARAIHADLIAMATHGHGGARHLLTGSVCERVIRSGVAPVLVVRP